MSKSHHSNQRQSFETYQCINAIMLQPLIPRVEEYNIKRHIKMKKMKYVKKVEKTIGKIRETLCWEKVAIMRQVSIII